MFAFQGRNVVVSVLVTSINSCPRVQYARRIRKDYEGTVSFSNRFVSCEI